MRKIISSTLNQNYSYYFLRDLRIIKCPLLEGRYLKEKKDAVSISAAHSPHLTLRKEPCEG